MYDRVGLYRGKKSLCCVNNSKKHLTKNGNIMKDKSGKVVHEPYVIKVLNTINFSKSLHYNPFAYIRSEKDILKLVTTIIVNTKGEGEKASEDFWVSATRSQAVKSLRTVLVY